MTILQNVNEVCLCVPHDSPTERQQRIFVCYVLLSLRTGITEFADCLCKGKILFFL